MLIIRAGIHKTLARIPNRENPDQTLHCLSRSFWQGASIQNFGMFTVFFYLQGTSVANLRIHKVEQNGIEKEETEAEEEDEGIHHCPR